MTIPYPLSSSSTARSIPDIQKPLALDFILPAELEAGEPPEARGLTRDEVGLMVSYRATDQIIHTQFSRIEDVLEPGDLLVINTSGTLNAAVPALRADGTELEVHLSTHLPADLWSVEVRLPDKDGAGTQPYYDIQAGETLKLPNDAEVHMHTPYIRDRLASVDRPTRLWIATLRLPSSVQAYLQAYGFPIRYKYVKQGWPLSYYQTVYTTEMGSAEMPSAGRAFTPELITRLVAHGVQIAPILLHTGVASLEQNESPYEEFYRVSSETARIVNATCVAGRRVVAIGTTVVRALETVTDRQGTTHAGEGWTSLIITPQRGLYAVDALLTGLHEPRSSHLLMLEALAGYEHLQHTYAEALRVGYLWHEFGDLHLILP
jgi:S-adenosylmethionine:tRNA ribosyltransferase-isomerase